jgi:hypothetical protein
MFWMNRVLWMQGMIRLTRDDGFDRLNLSVMVVMVALATSL